MENLLFGEYLYDGNYLQGADSNIDSGHEAHINNTICSTYAEDLVNIAKKLKQIDKKTIKKVEQSHDEYDPYAVLALYGEIEDVSPKSVSDPKLKEAMKALGGDSREYGCKYLGYIIIRNNNFELWELNNDTSKQIIDAIHEILNDEDVKEEDLKGQEIEVYSYKTKQSRTLTYEDLESHNLNISPSMPRTKANVPITLSGKGPRTQQWQSQYTSESFSFKTFVEFLKQRDA